MAGDRLPQAQQEVQLRLQLLGTFLRYFIRSESSGETLDLRKVKIGTYKKRKKQDSLNL